MIIYNSSKVQYFAVENSHYDTFFPKLKHSLAKIVSLGFSVFVSHNRNTTFTEIVYENQEHLNALLQMWANMWTTVCAYRFINVTLSGYHHRKLEATVWPCVGRSRCLRACHGVQTLDLYAETTTFYKFSSIWHPPHQFYIYSWK